MTQVQYDFAGSPAPDRMDLSPKGLMLQVGIDPVTHRAEVCRRFANAHGLPLLKPAACRAEPQVQPVSLLHHHRVPQETQHCYWCPEMLAVPGSLLGPRFQSPALPPPV